MTRLKLSIAAAAVIGAAAFSTTSMAAPVGGVSDLGVHAASQSAVTDVQYRGRYGYRPAPRLYRRGPGPWPFIGFGSLVAGAIIANQIYAPRRGYYYDTYDYRGPYYYPSNYRGDPREICARHFRSFEWSTGLYTTYGGEKRMCPYLG